MAFFDKLSVENLVAKWMVAAPGQFIPGLDFRLESRRRHGFDGGDPKGYAALSPRAMRELHRKGSFSVLGEVLNQYGGRVTCGAQRVWRSCCHGYI